MADVIQFSKLNPVLFNRADGGCYWINSTPEHESTMEFYNKWNQGDKIVFQITYDVSHFYILNGYIALRKCGTNEIITYPTPINITIDVNQVNMVVCTYSLTVPVVTGDYFLHLYLPINGGSTYEDFYTEPINIKSVQSNTVLFEYSCDGIQHDTWFINTLGNEIKYYFRCPGGFQSKDFAPVSVSNVYADQSNSFTLLSGISYITKKLTIGENYGVPNFTVDLVNRILNSDLTLKIDDVVYSKTPNSTIESIEYADKYTRGIWKVELAETPNDDHFGYEALPLVLVPETPVVIDILDIIHQSDLGAFGSYHIIQPNLMQIIAIDETDSAINIGVTFISDDEYEVDLSGTVGDIQIITLSI